MKNLTIIIPTLNEKKNIKIIYENIKKQLKNETKWEIVFVDDNSQDGTFAEIKNLIDRDNKVRGILRHDRRGLSSAVIEGFLSSSSKYFLVIDSDLQHDESKIIDLYNSIISENLDIVIASRFMSENTIKNLRFRFKISYLLTKFFSKLFSIKLKDPLSGFFIIKSDLIFKHYNIFSGISFKILLDIILSIGFKNLKIKEVAADLNERINEESKLDTRNIIDFIFLIIDKIFGRIIPLRFIKFSFVGLTGVFVQVLIVYMLLNFFLLEFKLANPISIIGATASNFLLNNYFTYSDKKLSGINIISGMLKFQIFCFFGSIINYYVSESLYNDYNNWTLAIIIGAITGAILNYAINNQFTWRKFNN